MMRVLLLLIPFLVIVVQVSSGQAPAAEYADSSKSKWRTVLAPGALKSRPDIVPVEAGFAISAGSFLDPTESFNSDWLLYDPASDRWASYGDPLEPSQLVNINDLREVQPEIATRFPADAEPGIQFVDGDEKAVFLQNAGENLADHSHYFGVSLIDLETGVITKLNIWSCWGMRYSDAIVWEFPAENLIVSCDMLVWHDDDAIRYEWTSSHLGQDRIGMLNLLSTSPDNRFWILRERFWYDPWYGNIYLYDRQTGWTTVLLWGDWGTGYNIATWLNDSTLIVNEGDYVMSFDTESLERRFALEDELLGLPDPQARTWLAPYLSRDGEWLLVFTDKGGLVLRNVFDALGIPG